MVAGLALSLFLVLKLAIYP